jgi:hypothetical protein
VTVVTIRGVRLVDVFDLSDAALRVLSRRKVHWLSEWDRLLDGRAWMTCGPAMVLFDLSNFSLDYAECERAAAVLSAAARNPGGGGR